MGDYQTITAFVSFLAVFILAALILGIRERKRTKSKLIQRLRAEFGRPSAKKTSPERFAQIPQYYLHQLRGQKEGSRFPFQKQRFFIDDITWNDLDMDRVFSQIDTTCSASGEEYLYYLLRSPAMKREDQPFSQEQYAYFEKGAHEDKRIRLQEILTNLGHAGRYSLYDYIDFTETLGEGSNLKHYIAAAAPFAAFALMFLHTGIGILVLLLVFCINLVTYFREKGRIAPYFQVFNYILRLLDCARALEKENCPVFGSENGQIPDLLSSFSSFRRGSSLLLGSTAGSADPLGLILEYVRILFHLDLIKFNSMLRQLRGRQNEIDALLTITGRIDACISIASWRGTLAFFARPVLSVSEYKGAAGAFRAEDLYHPLLDSPVPNSINARRPVLLTGSNASGKSTFLKAAALCALLSQSVGTAPARSYSGAFFRIYTSMALRDSLQNGESYFIVEIKSLRRILDASRENPLEGENAAASGINADDTRFSPIQADINSTAAAPPVLCCIDEVLRGTNTVERIAASAEILRCFTQTKTLCFAATHDLELTGLLGDVYDNYHFGEEIEDGDVRFSYRLFEGPSTSCNAIALLGSLGYDKNLVEKARARADGFLKQGNWK